jgi:hypothetical protein
MLDVIKPGVVMLNVMRTILNAVILDVVASHGLRRLLKLGRKTRAQCYKTFYHGNLPPFHGHAIILCYKATFTL